MSAPKKKVRNPLAPSDAPRTRKELMDYDYLNKLNPEELAYLGKFTDEYVGAAVVKTKTGKVKRGQLHNTKELAKDCYDRNNWRNNDVLGVTKANFLLSDINNELDNNDGFYITNPELTEDAIIQGMEDKDNSTILSYNEYQKLKHSMTPEMVLFYEAIYYEED